MFLSVMVSTTDFDSVSKGSNPLGTTNKKKMKRAGIISRIRKFIDSKDETIVLLLAYLLTIGLSIAWEVYTTK